MSHKVTKLVGAYFDGKFIKFPEMKMKYVNAIMKNRNKSELDLFGHRVIPKWEVFYEDYIPYKQPFN